MVKLKTVALVQARTNSTRFPKKVLANLGNESLVNLIAHRLSNSKLLDEVIFAIPDTESDDELFAHLSVSGHKTFRGDEKDVQKRFIDAGDAYKAEIAVRVTADCPLIDWNVVDDVVEKLIETGADYCSNTINPTFPDGLDVEAFKLRSLKFSRNLDPSKGAQEHVTTTLRQHESFVRVDFKSSEDFSNLRWTVDSIDDLRQLEANLVQGFQDMTYQMLLDSGFRGILSSKSRNEGSAMGEGQKLWSRAKEVIPGGSMLFSKKAEVMLPKFWPSYYKTAKGITVTDLDGNKYLDFSNMSVGACSLGYGNEKVNEAVKSAVDEGVMSTLNSPQEVQLAERMIELHPWSDAAKFSRSGGEANAIAIRIARAYTGRDYIAICGYHGWHDWYLSANLNSEDNLKSHLMNGVPPKGIPKVLANTVFPFAYNDLKGLAKLLSSGDVAAVKMEVSRSVGPNEGFLEGVRELCDKYGTVLIFDECTSGFRETFGGLHLKYGVNPDLAMFGKAMGNGFAISAVLGKGDVMKAAEETFISSTFWTERLGPTAALATLQEMERLRSWETLPKLGREMKQFWTETLSRLQIDAAVGGLDALPDFVINTHQWREAKTFITQEMLKSEFLANSTIYFSTEHHTEEISKYKNAIEKVLESLADAFYGNKDLGDLLDSDPIEVGFKRLN